MKLLQQQDQLSTIGRIESEEQQSRIKTPTAAEQDQLSTSGRIEPELQSRINYTILVAGLNLSSSSAGSKLLQ